MWQLSNCDQQAAFKEHEERRRMWSLWGVDPIGGRAALLGCKMQVPAARDIHLACLFPFRLPIMRTNHGRNSLKKQRGAAYCCARRLSCESKQMRWLNRTKRHRYSPIHWKRKHGCCRSEIGFASPTQGRFSTPSYISRAIFKSGARPLSHTYFLPFLVGFNSCIPGLTKGTQPKLTY